MKRKEASMYELLRRILYHDNVDKIKIEIEEKDMETVLTVYLKSGDVAREEFEDCMMDGAVRQAADFLGISNWEDENP